MSTERTYTSFAEDELIVTGTLATMLRATKERLAREPEVNPQIFDDGTGRQVDFDLRGDIEDILSREAPERPARGPGRPRLGVVSREVTLLPRHWEWLADQPSGASATLRRLVEDARKHESLQERARRIAAVTGRAMTALAGDRPNFEDAYRALDAGDSELFARLIGDWPSDVQRYLLTLSWR